MRVSGGFSIFAAACAALASDGALAQSPPAAANAVRVSVQRVDMPPTASGNLCVVHGQVSDVYAGQDYKLGQAIHIEVPCGQLTNARDNRPGPRFDSGLGEHMVDKQVLAASKQGMATLDANGRLVWSAPVIRGVPPGQRGISWPGGYRVLDGAVLPLGKSGVS